MTASLSKTSHNMTTLIHQPHGHHSDGRRMSRDSSLWAEETHKLLAPDADERGIFKYAVAIDGDYIVVGAAYNNGVKSGSAYIYRTTDAGGASWDLVQKLVVPDATEYNWFGEAVAIDRNYIVVGAPWDDDGSAYIYRTRDGSATWDIVQKIVAPDAAEGDFFGYAVAVDDNYVVVGARHDNDDSSSGSAYIYRTTDGGATWNFARKIVASDGNKGDGFGIAVAIDGNYIVVGAPWDNTSGSAYIYTTTDGGERWVQTMKLFAADAAPGVEFGLSVAIDAKLIAVGTCSAVVHIFFLSNGRWTPTKKIFPPDVSSASLRVAISGNSMVIGALGNDAASDSGSAFVHRTTNGGETWDFVHKIAAFHEAEDDVFGSAVAINGSSVAVDARHEDAGGDNSGAVYTCRQLTCANMTMSDDGADCS